MEETPHMNVSDCGLWTMMSKKGAGIGDGKEEA
jgi:hypothetical protein